MRTENLVSRKFRLISKIMRLDRVEDLCKLEDQIESIQQNVDARFIEAVRPVRASLTLEDMITEQNYKPIREAEFFRKTSELEIEESLEELLAQLD